MAVFDHFWVFGGLLLHVLIIITMTNYIFSESTRLYGHDNTHFNQFGWNAWTQYFFYAVRQRRNQELRVRHEMYDVLTLGITVICCLSDQRVREMYDVPRKLLFIR